jgi:hypothetical protein
MAGFHSGSSVYTNLMQMIEKVHEECAADVLVRQVPNTTGQ